MNELTYEYEVTAEDIVESKRRLDCNARGCQPVFSRSCNCPVAIALARVTEENEVRCGARALVSWKHPRAGVPLGTASMIKDGRAWIGALSEEAALFIIAFDGARPKNARPFKSEVTFRAQD